MPLMSPDEGTQKILNVYGGTTAKPTSWTLQLLTDANALADSDTSASHTQADGGGYAAKTLNPVGGSAPAATVSIVGGIPQIAWAQQTWTFTGALTGNPTITGYRIMDNAGTVIAQEKTTNFTPANNGDTYSVTPIVQLGNGTPA